MSRRSLRDEVCPSTTRPPQKLVNARKGRMNLLIVENHRDRSQIATRFGAELMKT